MAGFYRRSFVGAAIIGISVWCAAGTVAVISGEAASPRLIAFAPWWVALVAAALAWLVPGWRTHPITALPALLATLPWWPVPLPAVALMWTGPLAWVPIGAALLSAEGGRGLAWLGRAAGSRAQDPARATRLAAIGALVIGLVAAGAADPRVPDGDEPHYLVITQSLLQDGDLRIENNHVARDYAAFLERTINPDYLVPGRDDEIYSIHAPGVPALVLPGFAVFGFRGAQATLLLVFAVTGALVWRAAWRLTGETSAAWFAWAAVVGSTTMAVLSFMVFPDAPGACGVAAGVWLLVSLRGATSRAIVGVSALLGALPWLHTRFSVLAGAIGIAVVVMLMMDGSRPLIARWRRVATFAVVPAVSLLAWLWFFYAIYGTVDPRVAYGSNPQTRPWIWGAVAGLFVDQQFGLFTYAPVLFAALIGLVIRASGHWRRLSALSIGILLVYAMVVANYWMWWAGVPALPSRFMTAAVPLLTVPLAVVWSRSKAAGRSALLGLLTVSLAITGVVLAVDRGALAWNVRNGQATWLDWLSPVVNLPRSWPSFFWRSEGEFLWHAGLFVGIIVGTWWLLSLGLRQYSADNVRRRLGVVVWLLLGAMIVTQAGWTLTASAPLDPARAQLAVFTAPGRGIPVWEVGPGLRRWNPETVPLRVRSDQEPLADRPSSFVLIVADVPSGTYRLEVASQEAMSGELTVSIGRSITPLYRFPLTSSRAQTFEVSLSIGAAVLVAEAPNAELASQWQVTLVPTSAARSTPGRARISARYDDVDVFFLDENVFVEAEGFWVRGGRTAEIVLSKPAALTRQTGVLRVRNGGAENTVTIQSGAWQEVLSLAPWQERQVNLPLADTLGSWPLAVTSTSGFRPSDVSGQDARFLGVWIW